MKNFLTNKNLNHRNTEVIVDLREYYHIYNVIPSGEHKNTIKWLKNELITLLTEYERVLYVIEEIGTSEIEDNVKAYLFKLITVIKQHSVTVAVLTN